MHGRPTNVRQRESRSWFLGSRRQAPESFIQYVLKRLHNGRIVRNVTAKPVRRANKFLEFTQSDRSLQTAERCHSRWIRVHAITIKDSPVPAHGSSEERALAWVCLEPSCRQLS